MNPLFPFATLGVALVPAAQFAAATPRPSPQISPSPIVSRTDPLSWQSEALERIRASFAGRESEPAERVFKNIELLRGKPASRLPAMMSALTGLLGLTCTSCHVPDRWESDEKPAKRKAREHFAMQSHLNRDYFGGANAISCWTCHRGQPSPPIQ